MPRRETHGVRERVPAADDARVGAEDARRCERDERPRRGHEPQRPEEPQAARRPGERGVEEHGEGEGGDEDDPLHARQHRERDRPEREHLRPRRRALDGERDRPERQSRDRVEEHLRHHEPRVEEERRAERQRRGGEAPAGRGHAARPQEHRRGRERHDERLEELQRVVARREVAEREGAACERGVEDAVPGALAVQERHPPVLPQLEPASGVDRLVGHDPEAVEASPREPVDERRHADEGGEDERVPELSAPQHAAAGH